MTSKERLMAMLNGNAVDRPGVSFYEIGGFKIDPNDLDPFNIFNSSQWAPLLELAETQTDLIRMRGPGSKPAAGSRYGEFVSEKVYFKNDSRFTRTEVKTPGRVLSSLVRRDPLVLTDWQIEHLCKSSDDLHAWLQVPDDVWSREWDVGEILKEEDEVGERGIVMIDTPDPLCLAAQLFSMDMYVMTAFSERALFEAALDKFARVLYQKTEYVAKTVPGKLWRIFGPEYACEPYLSPELFRQYVVKYTGPMIEIIKRYGGYVRVHSHGRIKNVLPMIVEMGADAIDPIEPPPQGDVELDWVRKEYGKDLVLFGNIEITDIENLEPAQFEKTVAQTVAQGTSGEGRGFVLLPTASPYGRDIKSNVLENYKTMVRLVRQIGLNS